MTLHLNTSTCTGVFEEVVIYSHNMIANVQHLEINSWLQCVWKRWDDRCSSYQHYVTGVFEEVVMCRHNEINTYLQCVWKRWDHQAESSSATRVMCSVNSAGGNYCQVLCRNYYKIWNLEFKCFCKHYPEIWANPDPTHRWTLALFAVDPWQADQLHELATSFFYHNCHRRFYYSNTGRPIARISQNIFFYQSCHLRFYFSNTGISI